ncbi:MAG: hypothetical protein M1828_003741 [Chrysothrix sp. TS-e1954]|nr:MAG: hypothetical protein M1828_003741 [Chrysothrix sp. TS-e1954]
MPTSESPSTSQSTSTEQDNIIASLRMTLAELRLEVERKDLEYRVNKHELEVEILKREITNLELKAKFHEMMENETVGEAKPKMENDRMKAVNWWSAVGNTVAEPPLSTTTSTGTAKTQPAQRPRWRPGG